MGHRRALLAAALVSLLLSPAFVVASETVDRHGIEGEPISLDSTDPDFSDYLKQVKGLIQKNWSYPCVKNAETGTCEYKSTSVVVEFGILRDGPVAYVEIRTPSGFPIYDEYAIKAIKLATPLPPVPDALMDRMKPGSTGAAIRVKFNYVVATGLPDILR